jgi:hypothetical protein
MHHKQTTPAKLGFAAVVAAVAVAGLGSWVLAGLIPGSGTRQAKSDCLVELNVQGIDSPGSVSGGRVVTCTDGDPCDTDGVCGNSSCTFRVAVCINQQDPNLPECHPPTRLQKLHPNPRLAGAVPSPLEGSVCGTFVDIPVRSDKKRGMLRLGVNATAPKGTSPRRDRDTFVLKCLARTTPCSPTTSTTTTTTTPVGGGGSTTTTLQSISMGCEFHDGQCTGSCGPGSRCGAAAGTGSCECRNVSCGAADAPQCNGACASASDACVLDPFSFSCHCVSIP